MSDLIEGMARAMCWADCVVDPDGCRGPSECRPACWDLEMHQARAAWAYALARLREPSEAMMEAMSEEGAWPGEVTPGWAAALDGFALEHGLDGLEETPRG